MEKIIIIQNNVLDYFDDLIYELFEDEYFSYVESSEKYVNTITDFIYQNIANFPAKKTPNTLQNFGSKYIFYKSNARTTWFIFFEQQHTNFLVTNIINNHCNEAKWL